MQAYVNDRLQPYVEDCVLYNINHMLINFTNEQQHTLDIGQLPEQLQVCGMYGQSKQWYCDVSNVVSLRLVISWDGIGIESDGISMIKH